MSSDIEKPHKNMSLPVSNDMINPVFLNSEIAYIFLLFILILRLKFMCVCVCVIILSA